MQQRSVGKYILEIFSPLFVHMAVSFVVEMILILIYYMQHMPELLTLLESEKEITEQILEMAYSVYQYAVEMTAIAALATIPFLVWMTRKDLKKEKAAGILPNKKAPLSKYILVAGISIPVSIGLNNIVTLSNLAAYSEAYQEAAEALYAPSLPVQLVCLGLIIPIMEEYIFRGVIYKRMRRYATAKRAIISSAIFFGIYHGNSVQMIYGALCGLLLAYLYEKFGSLKAPIFAHMLMNIVACLLTDADGFTWMFSKPIRMALITIGCAALASTVFLEIRKIQEQPERPEESEVLQEC